MSVFKRFNGKKITSKDKNWGRGTWYMWKRVNGQIIHKPLKDALTKSDAEAAERSIIQDAFNQRYGILDRSMTFSKFADTVYRKYVKQKNVNQKAKLTDITTFMKYFGPQKLLVEITPQDCRDLQDKLLHTPTVRNSDRSPSTVNRTMTSLSKLFSLACEERKLDKNPMEYVATLDEPPPRLRTLSPEQKMNFWNEVTKNRLLFQIVMLAVNLPLRRGQILAITRESFDADRRILFVIKSKNRPPRPVPVNDAAFQILTELCAGVESGPVILYRGKPIKDFRRRWRRMLEKANINREYDKEKSAAENPTREENFHFHDLRTEFGTQLINRNVSPDIVRQLFAHSSMQITEGYIKTDSALFEAVNRLDDKVLDSEIIG